MKSGMPTAGELHRIVACQGSAQLTSAIAAMQTLDAKVGAPTYQNHLLIHDLACPQVQVEDFVKCITRLATVASTWDSISYVAGNVVEAAAQLPACSQMILGQNNSPLSETLRSQHPDSEKVCYGDGVGLNFSNGYYDPFLFNSFNASAPSRRGLGRRLRGWFKRATPSQRPQPSCPALAETAAEFDLHCLLLSNQFDQELERVECIAPDRFLALFDRFAGQTESLAPASHHLLSRLHGQSKQLVVLLTSNFSETLRMSVRGELEGYLEMLRSLPQGQEVQLLIKPHPRDSHEKIKQLEHQLDGKYASVVSLNDPHAFYLPFEALYARYLRQSWAASNSLHIATVSSACITLECLYGQACQLGFGSMHVVREFAPVWAPLRQKHEQDLRDIVHRIRNANYRVA